MSDVTEVTNTGQQAHFETDRSKLLIGGNRFIKADYTASGSDVTLLAGTVLGRISATSKVVPLTSGASNGSQFPVGVLAEDATILDGETASLFICNEGDVDESKLIWQGSDGLATAVSGKILRDRLASDTAGIRCVSADTITGPDNE